MKTNRLSGVRDGLFVPAKPSATLSLKGRAGRTRCAHDRACLMEALEPRQMLAVAVWTGAFDGQTWDNAGNWLVDGSEERTPTDGDDVFIDEGGSYAGDAVVFDVGDPVQVASLSATANGLNFVGGTLTVSGTMTMSRVSGLWTLTMGAGSTVHAGSITATNVVLGSSAGSNLLSAGAISISGNNVHTVFGTVHGLGGVTLDGTTGNALNMSATGVINGGSGDVVIGANGEGYADVNGTLIGNVITINTGETALGTAVVNAASNLVFNVPNAITAAGFAGMSINTPLITLAGTGGIGAAGSLFVGGSGDNEISGVTGSVGSIPGLRTKVTLGVSNLTLTGTAAFTSINGAGINLLNVTGFTDLTIVSEGAVQVDGSVSGGSMSVASQGAVQIVGTVSGDSLSVFAPSVDVIGTNLALTANLYVETADGFLVGSLVSAPLMEFVGVVESNSNILTAATRLRLVGTFQQVAGGAIITPRVELMGGTGMVYHLSSPDNQIEVFAGDLHPNHSYIDSGSVATTGDLVIEGFAGGSLDISARSVSQTDRIQVLALKVHADNDVVLDNVLNGLVAASVLPRVGTLTSVVLATGEGNTSLVVDQDNHGIQAGFVRLIGIGFTSPAGSNFGAIVASTLLLEGPGSFNLESDANAVDELHAAVGGSVIYRSNVQGVELVARGGAPVSVAGDLTISVIGNELATSTDVVVGGTMLLAAHQITQSGSLTAGATAIGTGTDTTLIVQTDSFNGFIDGNLTLTLIPHTNPAGVALDTFGGGGFGLLTFGDATITVSGASLFINAGVNTNGGDVSINAVGVAYAASPFNFLLSTNLALNISGTGVIAVLQGGDINVSSVSGFVAGTLQLQDRDGLTLGRGGSGLTVQTLDLGTFTVNQSADVFQSGPLTADAVVLDVGGSAELLDFNNSVGSFTGSVGSAFLYASIDSRPVTLNVSTALIGVGVNLLSSVSALNVIHASGPLGVDLRAGSITGGSIAGDRVVLSAYSDFIDVSGVQANSGLAAQAPGSITIATTGSTRVDAVALSFSPTSVDGIVAGGDVSLTLTGSTDIATRVIAQNLTVILNAGDLTTLGGAQVSVAGTVILTSLSGSSLFLEMGDISVGQLTANAPGAFVILVEADAVNVGPITARFVGVFAAGDVAVVGEITGTEAVAIEAGSGGSGGTLSLGQTITAPTVELSVAVGLGNGSITLLASSVVSDVLTTDAADLFIYGSPEFGQISASGNVHLFENSRITIRTHAYFDAPGSVLTVLGNAGLYAGASNNDSSINIYRIESDVSFDGGTLDLHTRGIVRITGGTPGNPSMLNGDLNIRANNLQLDGTLTSSSNRNLFIGTYSDGFDIKIGDDSFGPPFMGLTAAEVANIGPGFGSVQVGGTAELGSFGPRINFFGDTTWHANTVFTVSGPTDVLSFGATVRSANGASLTFNATDGSRFVVNGGTTNIISTGNVSFGAPVLLAGGLSIDTSGAAVPVAVLFTSGIDGFHGFGETPALSVLVNPDSTVLFQGSIGVGESVDTMSVSRPVMAEGRPAVQFGVAGEPFVSRVINTGAAGIVSLDANVLVYSELAVTTGTLNIAGTLIGGDAAAQFFAAISGIGSTIGGTVAGFATIQLYNNGGAFVLPAVLDTGFTVLSGAYVAGPAGLAITAAASVDGSITTAGSISFGGLLFVGIGAAIGETVLAPGGDITFGTETRLLEDLRVDMAGAPSNAQVRFAGTLDSYDPGSERSLGIVIGNEGRVVFERSVGNYAALSAIHIAPVPPPDLDNLPFVDFGATGGPPDSIVVRAAVLHLAARVSIFRGTDLQVGNLSVLGSLSGVEAPTLNVRVTDQGFIGGAVSGFLSLHLDGDTPGGPGQTLRLGGQLLSGLFVSIDGFVEALAAELQVFGDLQLSAALTSAGPVLFAGPVVIGGPMQALMSGGDITFMGPVALQADATVCAGPGFTVAFLSTIAVNGFTLTICGDEINFSGAVSGPGFLTLQQVSNFLPINFAYDPGGFARRAGDPTTDPFEDTLDITGDEYALFGDDLDTVVIGDPTATTTVDIGAITITSSTVVNAAGPGGKVRVRGDVRGTGGSGLGINGSFNTTELYASILLSGGVLEINDAIDVFVPLVTLATDTGVPAGAALTVVGSINSDPGQGNALDLSSGDAQIELQGSVGDDPMGLLGALDVQAGNTVLSGDEINTIGQQTYDTPVVVEGSVSVSTDGAPVAFNNTVSGGAGSDLTVAPGTGEVSFGAPVVLDSVVINTGADRTFAAAVQIGSLEVFGGEASFAAPATVLSGLLSGGSITGAGDITLTGLFTWSGGTLNGSGQLTVAAAGTLTIIAGDFKTLDRTVLNTGLVDWQSGDVAFAGTTVTNAGEIRISADGGTFSGTGTIDNNAGIIRRTGNDGTSTISGITVLNGTGGQIIVEQGILSILPPPPPPLDTAGLLALLDDPRDVLVNDGLIQVGPRGTLHVAGAFSQTTGGTLVALINGPTGFGRLVVDSRATLDGSLELRYVDGYDPAVLDPFAPSRWTVLIASETVGQFGQITSPALPPRRVLYATYINGTVEFLYTHICDTNRDGLLNPDDLGDFITEYFNPGNVQTPNFTIERDFNGDGMVDPDDLGDFIMNYYLEAWDQSPT
ncbi:MAG: hypothetical protein ACKVS8_14760 [Phycisphaerales bacterium]